MAYFPCPHYQRYWWFVSCKLYLNSLVYDRNIFWSSSKAFGNLWQSSEFFGKCSGTFVWPSEQFWKIFGNLRKLVGILRKIVKNAVISMSMWQKDNYTLAWSDEFYVLVARTISHSFAALTREILFLPLEHKIHIFSQPCNILYISCHIFFSRKCTAKTSAVDLLRPNTLKDAKTGFFFQKVRRGPLPFSLDQNKLCEISKILAWPEAKRLRTCMSVKLTLLLQKKLNTIFNQIGSLIVNNHRGFNRSY